MMNSDDITFSTKKCSKENLPWGIYVIWEMLKKLQTNLIKSNATHLLIELQQQQKKYWNLPEPSLKLRLWVELGKEGGRDIPQIVLVFFQLHISLKMQDCLAPIQRDVVLQKYNPSGFFCRCNNSWRDLLWSNKWSREGSSLPSSVMKVTFWKMEWGKGHNRGD